MSTHPPTEKPAGIDEEQALLPTHLGIVEPKHRHLDTTPRAAWDRFNGRGRKHVGVFQSIKAVILSSCTSFPVVVDCSLYLPPIHRLERVIGLHSRRLGFPLPTLGR